VENAFDTAAEKVHFEYSWKCNAMLVLQILVLQSVISSPLSAPKMSHWSYLTSLLTALSEYFLQTTVRKVKKSPLYGLTIDLSTDRASHAIMLVYVTFWDEGSMSAVTEYLCCCRLLCKDAECLFETIVNLSQLLHLTSAPSSAHFHWDSLCCTQAGACSSNSRSGK
jgi:hypothetical protein